MQEPLIDPNLSKALYTLVGALFTNLVVGWGKGIFAKHKLFRQLIAETQLVCRYIENNANRIEPEKDDESTFPLLTILRLPIHYAKIGDIITQEKLGRIASRFLSNCEHYNRIIELGERDGRRVQRKAEILNQGALIHNKPVRLYNQLASGEKIAHFAQADTYLAELRKCSNRYLQFAKWFPWYFFILRAEKLEGGTEANEV